MNDKCPNCGSDNTYFNGTLCECIKCKYQWCGKTPESMPDNDTKRELKEQNEKNKLAGY